MGWIIELCKAVSRNLKTWMLMADNLNQTLRTVDYCKTDIQNMGRYLDSINGVVQRIDKYGSEGAVRAIKEVGNKVGLLDDKLQDREGKLYDRINQLDNKLDQASKDLARLQGIVVNGKH
jgi:hypothetical protein